MKQIKLTLQEKGLAIKGEAINLNGEKYDFGFLLHYEEKSLAWAAGKKWCKEQGGELPSIEQLHIIAEHRDAINKVLEEAGKKVLGWWYWSKKECWWDKLRALCVGMIDGYVLCDYEYNLDNVRAVSAL